MAQYLRTLVSGDSKYDKFMRREKGVKLSLEELQGMKLFMQNCGNCHSGENFTDNDFHDIGLDTEFSEENERLHFGRGRITNKTEDNGKYITPTVRNISKTAPYMHDGRFKTLEEVLDFYVTGVVNSKNLDVEMRTAGKPGLLLTELEKKRIIQFLNTLTDEQFLRTR